MEPEETPQISTKPPKKPRSEAQKKATENALNILKARREAKKEQQIRAEKPKPAPVSTPPAGDYITRKDFEAYVASMKKSRKVEESESETESEPEPVVTKKATAPAPKPRARQVPQEPVKLSGYDLLDEMFFRRR